jgi:hypothetical protein
MANNADPALNTIVGLKDENTEEVKGVTLNVGTEYSANVKNNGLMLYKSATDSEEKKTITVKKIADKQKENIQIRIKLGKYKGFINHNIGRRPSMDQANGTYLAFENVKDNSGFLLIKSDDILSIQAEGGSIVPPNDAKPIGKNTDNLSNAAVVTGINRDDDDDNISAITENSQEKGAPKNINVNLQESNKPPNNIPPPPISAKKSVNAFDSPFDDRGVDVADDESIDLNQFGNDQSGKDGNIRPGSGGGKRRTSKRKGGASKKRVSKKERKTRKAKRAGRKA